MGKIIQMIATGDDSYIFLLGFDPEKKELTFRTSRNIQHLQKEKVVIQDNVVYTNLYYFGEGYLKPFLKQ